MEELSGRLRGSAGPEGLVRELLVSLAGYEAKRKLLRCGLCDAVAKHVPNGLGLMQSARESFSLQCAQQIHAMLEAGHWCLADPFQTRLNLDQVPLTQEALEAALQMVRTSPQVASLSLVRCGLDDACAQQLAAALPAMPWLTDLDLGWNHMDGPSAAAAVVSLLASCSSLRSLSLEGFAPDPDDFLAVAAALGRHPSLESLDLSSGHFEDEGAEALAASLPRRLTRLGLAGNDTYEAWPALGAAFAACTALKSLDLSLNELGPALPPGLITALGNHPSMTRLNLSCTGLGPESSAGVAALLSGRVPLQSLDLGDNNLGPEGAMAVFEALRRRDRPLDSLLLSECGIGSEGAAALGRAIAAGAVVRHLDLSMNAIGDEAGPDLLAAAVARPELQIVNLQRNALTMPTMAVLNKRLNLNLAEELQRLRRWRGERRRLVLWRTAVGRARWPRRELQ